MVMRSTVYIGDTKIDDPHLISGFCSIAVRFHFSAWYGTILRNKSKEDLLLFSRALIVTLSHSSFLSFFPSFRKFQEISTLSFMFETNPKNKILFVFCYSLHRYGAV